jgi:hypothetical protein
MSQNIAEQDIFEPQSRPASRRIAFCPTCKRPFLHGNGVYQDSCFETLPAQKGRTPTNGQVCPEYCSEKCLPGIPA